MHEGIILAKGQFYHSLFEMQPIIIFSPVSNFGDQSLYNDFGCIPFFLMFFLPIPFNKLPFSQWTHSCLRTILVGWKTEFFWQWIAFGRLSLFTCSCHPHLKYELYEKTRKTIFNDKKNPKILLFWPRYNFEETSGAEKNIHCVAYL